MQCETTLLTRAFLKHLFGQKKLKQSLLTLLSDYMRSERDNSNKTKLALMAIDSVGIHFVASAAKTYSLLASEAQQSTTLHRTQTISLCTF